MILNDVAAEGSSPYRLKRGTKASERPPRPPADSVPSLSSLNGPFQLAEYLALKVRHDPHDVKGIVEIPTGDGTDGGKGPDKNVWIYEHLRRLPIDLTPLIASLLTSCTRQTCPEMKAGEWQYLCTAHGGPGTEDCCAIDYILHTLDLTIALINSSKNFPSRMQIPPASLSHFPSLFRRLSRIFAHAYYHHRELFALAEAETSLYARFVALCERYDLVGENLLVIPRSAVSRLTSAEDSSDDDSEQDEDEDEDGDGMRGRDIATGEGGGQERRTHSLDRHPVSNLDPIQPPRLPPKDKEKETQKERSPGVKAEEISATPESRAHSQDTMTAQKFDRNMTLGKGTLGRGKQSRGTMLWTSGTPSVPEDEDVDDGTKAGAEPASYGAGDEGESEGEGVGGLTRSDSQDTMVHIGPETAPLVSDVESNEIGAVGDAKDLEAREDETGEVVPKDEIELLEEQGKLKSEPSVSPLPPSPATAAKEEPGSSSPSAVIVPPPVPSTGDGHDGLEEVKLEDEPVPGSAPGKTEAEESVPASTAAAAAPAAPAIPAKPVENVVLDKAIKPDTATKTSPLSPPRSPLKPQRTPRSPEKPKLKPKAKAGTPAKGTGSPAKPVVTPANVSTTTVTATTTSPTTSATAASNTNKAGPTGSTGAGDKTKSGVEDEQKTVGTKDVKEEETKDK